MVKFCPYYSFFFRWGGVMLGGGWVDQPLYIWGSIRNAWRKPREIHLVLAQGLNNLRSHRCMSKTTGVCESRSSAFLEELWGPLLRIWILEFYDKNFGCTPQEMPLFWRCQKAKIIKIDPWRGFPFSKILASLVCHWMDKVILPQRVVPSLLWGISLPKSNVYDWFLGFWT